MISIDFSQSITSGNALVAGECWFGTFLPVSTAMAVRNAGSGPHSELCTAAGPNARNKTQQDKFCVWSVSVPSIQFLCVNSKLQLFGNIPRPINQDLGVPGLSGMGKERPAPKEVMQGRDSSHRFSLYSKEICFYRHASGHWTQNLREFIQENNKSCKIQPIL